MFAYCNNNPVTYKDNDGYEPTYVLDTDGDGEADCYVYEYSCFKKYRVRGRVHIMYESGKVYIYTGISRSEFESTPYPEGFNQHTDLMVLDQTASSNPNMYAYQAQNTYDRCHSSILKCLLQYDADFDTPWDRSLSSLLGEWTAHNIFAPFDKSAQDVDFDNAEEDYDFFDYCDKAWQRFKKKF